MDKKIKDLYASCGIALFLCIMFYYTLSPLVTCLLDAYMFYIMIFVPFILPIYIVYDIENKEKYMEVEK